jgi:hypothetical protein
MKTKKWLLLYLKSKLNITFLCASTALAIIFFFVLPGIWGILTPLMIIFMYICTSFGVLLSHRGALEITTQQEQERMKKFNNKIDFYSNLRDRIACLRLASKSIKQAVQYFLLVAGNYLQKCKQLKTYSPQANAKIEEVLKICQIYLEEHDESATERRYQIMDQDNFDDYEQRTVSLIKAAAEEIKQKLDNDITGLSRKEQIAIIEELKE